MINIIDSYKTPDGRYEYRIETNNGILPPLSFKDEKTESELDKIITDMNNSCVVKELLEGT
jgi:hypothetical protein